MVGPLRVIDRLRVGSQETIYRVFDPRRGCEALLRQLSPQASRELSAEFYQRFSRACSISHRNVAATLEVLSVGGTPAACRMGGGLASGRMGINGHGTRCLASPRHPGDSGLEGGSRPGIMPWQPPRTAHSAHGTRRPENRWIGEPPWLTGCEELASYASDLAALGRIAAGWLAAGSQAQDNCA